jgi:hypothetical protein
MSGQPRVSARVSEHAPEGTCADATRHNGATASTSAGRSSWTSGTGIVCEGGPSGGLPSAQSIG